MLTSISEYEQAAPGEPSQQAIYFVHSYVTLTEDLTQDAAMF